jgi:integrase
VRDAIRLKHYSIRTELTYVDWIRRYILFHKAKHGVARHPAEMGVPEIETFLTHLAVEGHIAASTQNQALNVPTVLTHPEAMRVIERLDGVHQLMTRLLYGSGLRLMECVRLRVKACPVRSRRDLDFEYKQITVRDGKACPEPAEGATKTASLSSPKAQSSRSMPILLR